MSTTGKAGVAGLIHHASAWAREEIAIQTELQSALEEQGACVRQRGPEGLESATARVDAAYARAQESEGKRAKLFARFAQCWGVGAGTLTLGSICARAGEEAGALTELRAELREAALAVQATARQVGAILRMHRKITIEVLGTVLGRDEDGDIQGSGALLSTEA